MKSSLSKWVILSLHTNFIAISCSKPVLQYLKVMSTIKDCTILYVSNTQEQKCKLTHPLLYPAHPLRKLMADTYQVNILRL